MNELFTLNEEETQILKTLLLSYEGYTKYMTQVLTIGAILIWVGVGTFPSWIKFFMAIAYSIFIPIYLYHLNSFKNNIEEDLKNNIYTSQELVIAHKEEKQALYMVEEFFLISDNKERYQIYPEHLSKDIVKDDRVIAKILPHSKIIIDLKKI